MNKTNDFSFPVFKTKAAGVKRSFKLEDPKERQKYFEAKAGAEIKKIRVYLKNNTFVGFLLGKKNSGKGTYSKLFMEAVGGDRIAHISIGDIVRGVHKDLADKTKKKELIEYLKRKYRGPISIEQALQVILGRDTKTLLPTEVILALVERQIDRLKGKAIFIDGFPRDLDQISYSLYFRALMGYRDDPDFFVFIDLPESVIDERMKSRVVCPQCQTPRNTKLLATKDVEYDPVAKKFYLLCDNPSCGKKRMVAKEGDELGIEAIRNRIEIDDQIMKKLLVLNGISKIYLRNSIPQKNAGRFVDKYEITPAYSYEWNKDSNKVNVTESPWVVEDDAGEKSYSLLPVAVAVSLIKQVAKVLGL